MAPLCCLFSNRTQTQDLPIGRPETARSRRADREILRACSPGTDVPGAGGTCEGLFKRAQSCKARFKRVSLNSKVAMKVAKECTLSQFEGALFWERVI